MIVITAHACARYVERIAPSFSLAEARAEIATHERVILVAANFGCKCVRLGNGAKLILSGDHVVTVIARWDISKDCLPVGRRERWA